jgi:hypothetical protein
MNPPSDLIILAMAQANISHPWERYLSDVDACAIVDKYASLLMKTGASFDAALADKLLADSFSSHCDGGGSAARKLARSMSSPRA